MIILSAELLLLTWWYIFLPAEMTQRASKKNKCIVHTRTSDDCIAVIYLWFVILFNSAKCLYCVLCSHLGCARVCLQRGGLRPRLQASSHCLRVESTPKCIRDWISYPVSRPYYINSFSVTTWHRIIYSFRFWMIFLSLLLKKTVCKNPFCLVRALRAMSHVWGGSV